MGAYLSPFHSLPLTRLSARPSHNQLSVVHYYRNHHHHTLGDAATRIWAQLQPSDRRDEGVAGVLGPAVVRVRI